MADKGAANKVPVRCTSLFDARYLVNLCYVQDTTPNPPSAASPPNPEVPFTSQKRPFMAHTQKRYESATPGFREAVDRERAQQHSRSANGPAPPATGSFKEGAKDHLNATFHPALKVSRFIPFHGDVFVHRRSNRKRTTLRSLAARSAEVKAPAKKPLRSLPRPRHHGLYRRPVCQ